ncbi:proline--tRNA ligase [Candidatus Dependentiae bacterium]|nr:proline--tRNA ligase [Candidatus Dependentiae bacterium]
MEKLSSMETDFSQWYQDVIFKSELVDLSPTKGCFVIRPYGYALWENIKNILDQKISLTGTENAYFPLLIPESFLKKEEKHIEGFSPELAVVTHAGGQELEEPLIVRPTSETMIYYMFARWIKSWRDLPLKINQWANVIRWEMRPRAFLRSIEFLWQEGHTAHITQEQAIQMAKIALDIYKDILENYLAIPVISGIKSESEKFAGAHCTYTLEGMMQNGKALQMCTSHVLNHSFSQSFDIKFQDEDGEVKSPYCSSWGMTTRVLGALIMVHGDQNGLIIPPKIAPIKAVIIPIYKNDDERDLVLSVANNLKEELCEKDFIVVIDRDENKTPGSKFFQWELKGVPVRIEIGPRDIEKKQAVLVSRIKSDIIQKKKFVTIDNIKKDLNQLLETIQNELFQKARGNLSSKWNQAYKLEDFGPILYEENGFYQAGWCCSKKCEHKLKGYRASIRCILDSKNNKTCFYCGQSSRNDVLIAKAY